VHDVPGVDVEVGVGVVLGVVVAVGVEIGVVVAAAVGVGVVLPPQELPFKAKFVGVLLLPLKVAWKPNCIDPPAGTEVLYATFCAVTAAPL
jgi:hypothetical protein